MARHLMSVGEIRQRLGLSRQRVYQLTQRSDWPDPYDTLSIGKVWRREEIEGWIAAQHAPAREPVGNVLYVIACGGKPAEDIPAFVTRLLNDGWDVCVIATRDGRKFFDTEVLEEVTGHPVRSEYKQPDEPDVLPPPDAFVVAPATFNTVNKMAAGISDTLALGLLNEGLGLGKPVIVAPAVNGGLAGHPGYRRSTDRLREWGVTLITSATPFPWENVFGTIENLPRDSEQTADRPAQRKWTPRNPGLIQPR